jgi:hypothetical protein
MPTTTEALYHPDLQHLWPNSQDKQTRQPMKTPLPPTIPAKTRPRESLAPPACRIRTRSWAPIKRYNTLLPREAVCPMIPSVTIIAFDQIYLEHTQRKLYLLRRECEYHDCILGGIPADSPNSIPRLQSN